MNNILQRIFKNLNFPYKFVATFLQNISSLEID